MHVDETKITSYLLGEITDPRQVREIELAIAANQALQRFAEETLELQQNLTRAYENESFTPLDFPSFTETAAPVLFDDSVGAYRSAWLPWVSGLAASFGLVVCLFLLSFKMEESSTSDQVQVQVTPVNNTANGIEFSNISADNQATQSLEGIRAEWYPNPVIPNFEPGAFSMFELEVDRLIADRGFTNTWQYPLSGFSMTPDSGDFEKLKATLAQGHLPSPSSVKIESLINAFPYNYGVPQSLEEPFEVHMEQAISPWINGHTILRIGVQGYEIPWADRPDNNLVFRVDVSGSMDEPNKLPLVRSGIRSLIEALSSHDRVAIVTYGEASEVILPPTRTYNKVAIEASLDRLLPGGSTRATAGVVEAYRISAEGFIEGGNNQLIVCTDGDLSLGLSDRLLRDKLIAREAARGIGLSTYGFSVGYNRKVGMEELAALGNGKVGYVDSDKDLERIFVGQVSGARMTIANNVRVEVAFNPEKVDRYRLIGFENDGETRAEKREQDLQANGIQSGHSVTALYELIPTDVVRDPDPEAVKVHPVSSVQQALEGSELVKVRVRYQQEGLSQSQLLEVLFSEEAVAFDKATPDFQFAAAVTAFGQILRNSPHRGDVSYEWILSTAQKAAGLQLSQDRESFLEMVRQAEAIENSDTSATDD